VAFFQGDSIIISIFLFFLLRLKATFISLSTFDPGVLKPTFAINAVFVCK
jgi:hypothetical protein